LDQHCFYTAVYADQIATFLGLDVNRGALLKRALWHDAVEVATSDIPGPWKRQAVDNRIHYDQQEVKVLGEFFPGREWAQPGDPRINKIVKVAELVDEAMYLATEMSLGNMSVKAVFDESVLIRLQCAIEELTDMAGMSGREIPLDYYVVQDLKNKIWGAIEDQKAPKVRFLRA
jgi:5'-deoxynucleotidase YfbR-like HD superfamily hydrolase